MSKTPALPVFETERLVLRAVTAADAAGYERNFADYAVISHLASVVPWPFPPGGTLEFLRRTIWPAQGKDRWLWGIFLKENPDEAVGAVDLRRKADPVGNRGFWLARRLWGQGLMTEALRPVMDYAFGPLEFDRIILDNARGNAASRRVKEKTGARLMRVEPAPGAFVNPAYDEREVWELTREDWEAHHG